MSYTCAADEPDFLLYYPDDIQRPVDDIWVVEDSPQILKLAGVVLGSTYRVRGFSDGQQAYDALKRNRGTRLLLTDTNMPGMDGLALIREARERIPDLAVILMSGNEDGRLEANATGLEVPFLHKPFELDALRNIVAQHYPKKQ